jgi:hypothetical protein
MANDGTLISLPVNSDRYSIHELLGRRRMMNKDACFENLPDWPYEPQYVEIDGLRQAYVDVGSGESGETILLLHGQPSWSYLYRHMIPVLADAGHRVIAMDLVGMGRSDKPVDPDYYTYLGHVERLETFIQELELEQGNLTIFVQDWGSLIGLQVSGQTRTGLTVWLSATASCRDLKKGQRRSRCPIIRGLHATYSTGKGVQNYENRKK